MSAEVKTTRSRLREEQTQLTRRRILEAAGRLFVGRGYGNVTMQEVAREAGVAYQTVFSQFGGKLQLAVELCNSEIAHVGASVAMVMAARDAGDPEAWLRSLGRFARTLYEPCAEVLRFMRESGDTDLLSRLNEIDSRRLQLLAELGPQLAKANRLRPGLSAQAAVDLVWSLTGPATYQQLVLDRGWTPDDFEEWLGPALADLILVA
jgi:TetR/AcrR family transcriptional regulator, regulator of autoinduction and epiphytic fitness